jgi:hypothetical protein
MEKNIEQPLAGMDTTVPTPPVPDGANMDMPNLGGSDEPVGPSMSPEEDPNVTSKAAMMAELDRQFEDVKNRDRELGTKEYISRNKIKQARMELMKKFFDSLQEAGVDPNNLESIGLFLENLRRHDPDLVTLFEMIVNELDPQKEDTGKTASDEADPEILNKLNSLRDGLTNVAEKTETGGFNPSQEPIQEPIINSNIPNQ